MKKKEKLMAIIINKNCWVMACKGCPIAYRCKKDNQFKSYTNILETSYYLAIEEYIKLYNKEDILEYLL